MTEKILIKNQYSISITFFFLLNSTKRRNAIQIFFAHKVLRKYAFFIKFLIKMVKEHWKDIGNIEWKKIDKNKAKQGYREKERNRDRKKEWKNEKAIDRNREPKEIKSKID